MLIVLRRSNNVTATVILGRADKADGERRHDDTEPQRSFTALTEHQLLRPEINHIHTLSFIFRFMAPKGLH